MMNCTIFLLISSALMFQSCGDGVFPVATDSACVVISEAFPDGVRLTDGEFNALRHETKASLASLKLYAKDNCEAPG